MASSFNKTLLNHCITDDKIKRQAFVGVTIFGQWNENEVAGFVEPLQGALNLRGQLTCEENINIYRN